MSKLRGDSASLKWWGWGLRRERYPVPERLWSFLENSLGALPPAPPVPCLRDISLPAPRLSGKDLSELKKIFGAGGIASEPGERLIHCLGKSYLDLVRLRQGRIESAPDAVVFPEQEKQISSLLNLASARNWAVIPFGGGTSVVGGIEPAGQSRPVVSLDLCRLNRLVALDTISGIARVQVGIRGPELEANLNSRGFTLGHFPQSFEFSTLGGWIATRSAGQNSTRYGKIEDMVVSLRLICPQGIVDCPVVPADATGPSVLQCLIGSEGTLGVITEAVLRLRPLPRSRRLASYLFPDFFTGVTAVRRLLQAGACPAVVRLSDPEETALLAMLSSSAISGPKQRLLRWYLRRRGVALEQAALLILIFEGPAWLVSASRRQARRFLEPGVYLGTGPSREWLKSRFRHPYLRDELLDRSVMVDTLETAAPWERLPELYSAVRQSLLSAIRQTAPAALVLAHLSHAYPDGASLYFTFLARQQAGREESQWRTVKAAATETILNYGGALSHHHGIGSVHRPWLPRYLGPEALALLRQLKSRLDPGNIMNPGKIIGS